MRRVQLLMPTIIVAIKPSVVAVNYNNGSWQIKNIKQVVALKCVT